MRDLTPFGFLRLYVRPASAVLAPPGTFGVEVDLGYQKTRAHQKIAHGNAKRVLRM